MAETIDLRGKQRRPVPAAVLADPSGRRARVLARAGGAVAIVGVLWLAGLVLAGLGILPSGVVPLGRALAVPAAPPLLRGLSLRPGTPSDLEPALPALGTGPGATTGVRASHAGRRAKPSGGGITVRGGATHHGHGSGASGKTGSHGPAKTTGGGAGGKATGAGATKSTGRTSAPGRTTRQTSPGHTKTSPPGKSGSALGKVKQTTTTSASRGHSGSASGQTVTNGYGHGPGG
jgi:hypothetical protein